MLLPFFNLSRYSLPSPYGSINPFLSFIAAAICFLAFFPDNGLCSNEYIPACLAFSTAGENGSIDFFPSIAFCFNGLEPPIAAPPDPLLGFPLFGFPSFGPGDGFVGFMPDPPNPKNPFPSFAD